MKIYIKLSGDYLELPVAVAGSVRELAECTGDDYTNIYSALSKSKKRKKADGVRKCGQYLKYACVEVSDDMQEEG